MVARAHVAPNWIEWRNGKVVRQRTYPKPLAQPDQRPSA